MKVTIELDLNSPKHQKLMQAFLASQSATDTSVGEVAPAVPAAVEPAPAVPAAVEPAPAVPAAVEVPVPLKQQLFDAFNAASKADHLAAGNSAKKASDEHGKNSDAWPEEITKQVITQLQAIAVL